MMTCPTSTLGPISLTFERSPGGTPEVSPEQVAAERCNLRIVDVRERHELLSPLGHIEGARWVPLRELAREAERWDRREPLVLVDRSGRRSGRAARYLADLGFERVASMTGGMMAWERLGHPVTQAQDFTSRPTLVHAAGPTERLTVADVEIHLGDPSQVRWTKAATLLLHGTESCVDGRDTHAVIGTPGGDAGELLAALATAEALAGDPLSSAEVERLFDEYVEAFGHFYMHTDEHGLLELAAALGRDPRFADWHARLGDLEAVEGLVRQPPQELQPALLVHLIEPSAIGCGHLRLMRLHPDEYEVRPSLMDAFFRAFFHRLWRGSDELEWVVLAGEHNEGAVLDIRLAGDVHPYTTIPMVAPRHMGTDMFVHHPQVASFIRRQNAAFLIERTSWPRRDELEADRFFERLDQLASHQLARTLHHLAEGLAVFEVRFEGTTFHVIER